jgi:hypothetical protein
MKAYSKSVRQKIQDLRRAGYTYSEIQDTLGQKIPKGTLSYMCRDISLTETQRERIYDILRSQLVEKRKKAVAANRKILEDKINGYKEANEDLANVMQDRHAKLIALAMLYLGEGAKWKGRRGLHLGSSDPLIVNLYIDLLRECYGIPLSALKCRIQHRADQDPDILLHFWSNATGVPLKSFYPCYVDKRTIGKTTKKTNYRGVCGVSCAGTHVQLELEQIAGIISGALRGISSVG